MEARHSDSASPHRRHLRPSARLKDTRLFASGYLSTQEKSALEQAAGPAKPVGPGVDLISEGESADSLFFVVAGWACRYTTTRTGARQLPALLIPGDIGNLDSLLLDPLDYGVRTLTDTMIVAIARDRALALCAQHAGIARSFTWLALIENVTLSKWALSLGRLSARERLGHLLCELSVRLGVEEGDESSFFFPLTQEQLGDVLGLTSVHVNRTMQQLREDGLISAKQRTMVLRDLPRLRELSGFDPRYLHIDAPSAAQAA